MEIKDHGRGSVIKMLKLTVSLRQTTNLHLQLSKAQQQQQRPPITLPFMPLLPKVIYECHTTSCVSNECCH